MYGESQAAKLALKQVATIIITTDTYIIIIIIIMFSSDSLDCR